MLLYREIPTEPSHCRTLAEYREFVLRCSQRDVARKARCKQSWISQVERGHLPKARHWDALVKAYDLTETEFVRMVINAKQLNEIQKPIDEEKHPLFFTTQTKPQVTKIDDQCHLDKAANDN